jgi:hypothetical protein
LILEIMNLPVRFPFLERGPTMAKLGAYIIHDSNDGL